MNKNLRNVCFLVVVCVALIVVAGHFAFKSTNEDRKEKLTLAEFLGLKPVPSLKSVLVGMSAGLVFGFIDNFGLYFGMSALDPYLPKDKLLAAGLGNTFSDGVGAFLATFVGVIITNKSGVENYPILSEAVGIIIGCLIGTYLPGLFLKK